MFELNATLPIFVVMFLGFMSLLNSMVLKPMGAKIEQRQRKIEGDLESGKDAHQDRQKLVKDLKEKGQRQLQVAQRNFAGERQNLIGQLADEEQTLVSTIVRKLLGDSVTVAIDADRARAVLAEEAS